MNNVDVVIPLYNGQKWIKETIDSIKNQSIKVSQIIVVDDGSTDLSREVVSSIEGVTLIHNEEGGHAAGARNYGFKFTDAPYVIFMDQDDLWHEDHLKNLVQILDENPQATAATSIYKCFQDGRGEPSYEMDNPRIEEDRLWEKFPFAEYCEPALILFRREVFDTISWVTTYDGYSDLVIRLQVAVKGKILSNNLASVARRIHVESHYQAMIKDPIAFYKNYMDLSDELFDYYVENGGNEEKLEFINQRRLLMHNMYDLIYGIVHEDVSSFKKGVFGVETLFFNEDDELLLEKHRDNLWTLIRRIDIDENWITNPSIYRFILEHYPKQCKYFRKYVVDKIIIDRPGNKFYVDYYFSKPFEVGRAKIFLRALYNKFRPTLAT